MIDFYHDQDKGISKARAFGSPTELAADIAICTCALYVRVKAASSTAAAQLKVALMGAFQEDSPIWTAKVHQGSEADMIFIVSNDPREADRQAKEGDDADT